MRSLLIIPFAILYCTALRFETTNLIVDKPELVSAGEDVTFYCQIPDSSPESISACRIITPGGEIWTVENGQVLDDGQQVVPGYLGVDNGDDTKNCGINIQAVDSANDMGN